MMHQADVIGISRDRPETLVRYKSEHNLPFTLVSDRNGAIHRAYEVNRRLGLGVKRVSYLIQKGGIVRAVSNHEVRIAMHVSDMLKALEHL